MERKDEGLGFLLRYENVAWYEDGKVRILDRRIYPMKEQFVVCENHHEAAQAIQDMVTQSGGPYTAAAMGMALAGHEAEEKEDEAYLSYLKDAAYTLAHARPTTSAKMEDVTNRALSLAKTCVDKGMDHSDITNKLFEDAVASMNEKYERYDAAARYLADLIPDGGTIMTQCFAETIIGTLLRECRRRGNEIHLYCPETRPYLQGARLTASVAADMGFDVTVITDNMPASLLSQGKIDLFTSAADVITMDGHVVNKVGTLQIAICADRYGVPYYVTGSPGKAHQDMSDVVIEERDPEQSVSFFGQRTVKDGVKGYYPAFDVTPPELVRGIVTSKGIYTPENLSAYFK